MTLLTKTIGTFNCVPLNDDEEIDLEKVKEVVISNGIQITKASVSKQNGDVYVELPSEEQREKLVPLLKDEVVSGNTIIDMKKKYPVITIRNVSEYNSEEDFVSKIKAQNPQIREYIENGSQFSVVFKKEHNVNYGQNGLILDRVEKAFQVVVRVSEEIRQCLKSNNDRLYIGIQAYKVFDRFHVKSCASCHRFDHYHRDCRANACCGYCSAEDHVSEDCPFHEQKDQEKYKCVNCADAGKDPCGHSSHWYKCPTYLERQEKMKKGIPN